MPIIVHWSDDLEELADELFRTWLAKRNLFRKTCVVVRDMATRDWLKSHYLMGGVHRQIMMDLDFIPLEQFVNNWLFAKTHDTSLDTRNPLTHPYAKPVLSWRIYRILSDEKNLQGEMAPLRTYIGNDPTKVPMRRHALAEQLAKLFDDYLNYRFSMLYNWEHTDQSKPDGVQNWQRSLYQMLAKEDPHTYANDYYNAIKDNTLPPATANGFPDYLSVHLFDIPDMPAPTLFLLEKIAEEFNVTFWSFNPGGDWLPEETLTRREFLRATREALTKGGIPPEISLNTVFTGPRDKLLGTFATGARALLGQQEEWTETSQHDVKVLGTPGKAFATLEQAKIAIHSCYSPRRELEAVRDGLHQFFQEHPDATPRDALVLCGDWEHYAPIVEAVFNNVQTSDHKIDLPLNVAGGIPGETPMSRSFNDLLAFRSNRFEVSTVFALLGVPAIARHFGLDVNTVDLLEEMAKKANIHWGLDDDDVNVTIGFQQKQKNYPFTWRRGLDRLALDMLCGEHDSDDALVETNALGEIRPVGNVEGTERVNALKSLNDFILALAQLRRDFAPGCSRTVEDWQEKLLKVVETFYDAGNEFFPELKRIRTAIQQVAKSAEIAKVSEEINGEVFLQAVLNNIQSTIPGPRTSADAVVFAPLKNASATPHRFIWICGLNDGAFPHIEHRTSFDVLGKHPSIFDVNSRDRDGFALLKAVLATRSQLSLSYVGHDIRSNEKIPASVMLTELDEYFQAVGNTPQRYEHPLHAYSPRYFIAGTALPQSHTKANYQIAQALLNKRQDETPANGTFTAFTLNETGDTVIDADDLASFFAHPNNFLIKKRLALNTTLFDSLADEDVQTIKVDKSTTSKLLLDTEGKVDSSSLAKILVETGNAPNDEMAESEIAQILDDQNTIDMRTYPLHFPTKNADCTCPDVTVVDAYNCFLESKPSYIDTTVDIILDGNQIHIPFRLRSISLETQGGALEHTFYMENAQKIYDSSKVHHWIRHVIGHAAGLTFVTVVFCQKNGPARTFRPLDKESAQELLEKYLRMVFAPLPPEYPNFEKAKSLSDDVPFGDIQTEIKTIDTKRPPQSK